MPSPFREKVSAQQTDEGAQIDEGAQTDEGARIRAKEIS